MEEYHTPYDADYYVITAWNGAGTALVFSSKESYERMLDEYEQYREAFSLPWLHAKAAVNGDHVLGAWDAGLRPWIVTLIVDGGVSNVKPKPLHHVTLELIQQRFKNGAPRVLEVWAPNEQHAKMFALDVMSRGNTPEADPGAEVSFDRDVEPEPATVPEPAPAPAPRSAKAPSGFIPGFGNVVPLDQL